RVESLVLEKLGADGPAHIRSSWGLLLVGELDVDRGRCADVAALAEASAAVNDAGRMRHRPELLFLDAGCRLNAGRARDAAAEFGILLGESPDAPRAREAAYYRFRALDVARAADPALVARAALLGAAVAAGGMPPDDATALALLDGFETRYPEARDLHFRALELRLGARVGARRLDGVEGDLARYLAEAPAGPDRRRTLAHLGRELA